MKHVLGVRIIVALVVALMSVISVAVIEYQHSQQVKFNRDQIVRTAQRELLVIRSNLEADIYSDIFFASSLATIISVTPDSSKSQWYDAAENLFSKSSHLRNIGLAPDDVIQFVYPLKGNEAALGLDFRTIPAQWETVIKARQQQSIFIAGPVNLVQGGVGLIARTPIFTDPPFNLEYWGTCSVVLDIESLFTEAGIDEIEKRYSFAIRGKDGKGAQGEVFWGDPSVFESIYAGETVVLPSGVWEMAISLDSLFDRVPYYEKHASRLIGYPIALLIIVSIITIYYLYLRAHGRSMQDDLTHIPNRRYFIYTLEQMVSNSKKRKGGFTLLNIDIDNFKSVNDTYGHAIGDKILVETAARIKSSLRTSDIVARMGGDEFLILLPRVTDEENIESIIRNMRDVVSKKPYQFGDKRIFSDVSIGYAVFNNSERSADSLLSKADHAMYQEKKSKFSSETASSDN